MSFAIFSTSHSRISASVHPRPHPFIMPSAHCLSCETSREYTPPAPPPLTPPLDPLIRRSIRALLAQLLNNQNRETVVETAQSSPPLPTRAQPGSVQSPEDMGKETFAIVTLPCSPSRRRTSGQHSGKFDQGHTTNSQIPPSANDCATTIQSPSNEGPESATDFDTCHNGNMCRKPFHKAMLEGTRCRFIAHEARLKSMKQRKEVPQVVERWGWGAETEI